MWHRNNEVSWSWKSSQARPSHPQRLPHCRFPFFVFFFSELLNGRSVPHLPRSFSLLPYLLGNAIYLDVHRKAQPPQLVQENPLGCTFEGEFLGMSEGQNALLGRMEWPGRMELATDLKLYENVVFLGKVGNNACLLSLSLLPKYFKYKNCTASFLSFF